MLRRPAADPPSVSGRARVVRLQPRSDALRGVVPCQKTSAQAPLLATSRRTRVRPVAPSTRTAYSDLSAPRRYNVRDEAVPSGEKDIKAPESNVDVTAGSLRNSATCGNRFDRRTGTSIGVSIPAAISRVRTPSALLSTYVPTMNVPSAALSCSATFADRATACARASASRLAR